MVTEAPAITIEFIEEKRRSGIYLEGCVRWSKAGSSAGRTGRYGPAEHLRDWKLLLDYLGRAIDVLATEDGVLVGCLEDKGAEAPGDGYALRHVLGDQFAAVVESLDPELGIPLYVLTLEQFRRGGLPTWLTEVDLLRVWPLLPEAVVSASAAIPSSKDRNYLRGYAALTGRPGWMLSKEGYDAVPVLRLELENIGQLEGIVAAFKRDADDQPRQQTRMQVEFSLLSDRTWRLQDTVRELVGRIFLGLVLLIIAPFVWLMVFPFLLFVWLWRRLMRFCH